MQFSSKANRASHHKLLYLVLRIGASPEAAQHVAMDAPQQRDYILNVQLGARFRGQRESFRLLPRGSITVVNAFLFKHSQFLDIYSSGGVQA